MHYPALGRPFLLVRREAQVKERLQVPIQEMYFVFLVAADVVSLKVAFHVLVKHRSQNTFALHFDCLFTPFIMIKVHHFYPNLYITRVLSKLGS